MHELRSVPGGAWQEKSVKQAKDIVARGRVLGQGRGPLVCIPVVSRQRDEILDEVAAAVGQLPDLIEWRADFFADVAETNEVLGLAAEIREAVEDIPLIFTIRTEREGGEPVELNDEGIANLRVEVCASRLAEFVDVEMSAPEVQLRAVLETAKANDTRVVLSYHNFRETPGVEQLLGKFVRAESLGGDVAKVAVMPKNLDDVLVLLEATLQASRETSLPLVSISMGELGAVTRVIGWYFGSAITFAAGRQSSAPGQLSVEDVRTLVETLARHQGS